MSNYFNDYDDAKRAMIDEAAVYNTRTFSADEIRDIAEAMYETKTGK